MNFKNLEKALEALERGAKVDMVVLYPPQDSTQIQCTYFIENKEELNNLGGGITMMELVNDYQAEISFVINPKDVTYTHVVDYYKDGKVVLTNNLSTCPIISKDVYWYGVLNSILNQSALILDDKIINKCYSDYDYSVQYLKQNEL